jgi:peptide methionine sulfoxide reductase msrA/msrB
MFKQNNSQPRQLKDIYLAGGCFWGVQAYLQRLKGVYATTVGYANGDGAHPVYASIGHSGHAETVHVRYDPAQISLQDLIRRFFTIIDPCSRNRQGGDIGRQYRSGVYYTDAAEGELIAALMQERQAAYSLPIVTEILPLRNYCLAEEYHQDYLRKNPGGYCHIDLGHVNTI